MIKTPRILLAIAAAILLAGTARSQSVVLEIDWSDLSAVTFTATGANSFSNYAGTSTIGDGLDLINFFTSTRPGDSSVGAATSSSLYHNLTSTLFFNNIVVWDYASEGNDDTRDLNIYLSGVGSSTVFTYSTATTALTGTATFDLSSKSTYTDYFPALGTEGDIYIDLGGPQIGRWKIVGAATAVPEPSTYAAILGAIAFLGVVVIRRRGKV